MNPTAARKWAAASAVALVYASVLRPRIQWLGTSDDERTATYPGDDLILGGRRYGAMATTIATPPERVWPWLVQMGCDRAGFYSFDRLDNGGRPSADRIHTEWQNLREGDRIASTPDASRWFDVALLVPERALVLRASLTVPAARNFDPAGGFPRAYSDSTWGFFLRPTVDGHTRLVVTGKARGKPCALIAGRQLAVVGPGPLGDAAQAVRRATPPRRVCALRPCRHTGDGGRRRERHRSVG